MTTTKPPSEQDREIDIRLEAEQIVTQRDRLAPDNVLVGDVVALCDRIKAAAYTRGAADMAGRAAEVARRRAKACEAKAAEVPEFAKEWMSCAAQIEQLAEKLGRLSPNIEE